MDVSTVCDGMDVGTGYTQEDNRNKRTMKGKRRRMYLIICGNKKREDFSSQKYS
jgi:hypothetical protein